MPRVSESHEISRAASRLILGRLPPSWPATNPQEGDDYGIDMTVTIATRGRITGRFAHLQIKGTRSPQEAERLRARPSTIRYLRSVSDIALFVRVLVPDAKCWIVPARDDRFSQDANEESGLISVHLAGDDAVPLDEVGQVIDTLSYRQWWLSQHRARQRIAVRLHGPDLIAERKAVATIAPYLPGWLSVDNAAPAHLETLQALVLVDPDGAIAVRDAARPGRSLQIPRVEGAIADVPCLNALQLALGLYDIGLRPAAAELATHALPEHPGPLCASARRLLADAHVVLGDSAVRSVFLGAALQQHMWWIDELMNVYLQEMSIPLTVREFDFLLAHMTRAGSAHRRAVLFFNASNLVSKLGEKAVALTYSDKARKADGSYAKKSRYWEQRGTILLDLGRYAEAENAYRRAVQLGMDAGRAAVFIADLHLMAGSPGRARQAIAGQGPLLSLEDLPFEDLRKVIVFVLENWEGADVGVTQELAAQELAAAEERSPANGSATARLVAALMLALVRRTLDDWSYAIMVASIDSDSDDMRPVADAVFSYSALMFGGEVLEAVRALLPDEGAQAVLAAMQRKLDARRAIMMPRRIYDSRS